MIKYNFSNSLAGVRVIKDTIVPTEEGNLSIQDLYLLMNNAIASMDKSIAVITDIENNINASVGTMGVDIQTSKDDIIILKDGVNLINTKITNMGDVNLKFNNLEVKNTSQDSKITALETTTSEILVDNTNIKARLLTNDNATSTNTNDLVIVKQDIASLLSSDTSITTRLTTAESKIVSHTNTLSIVSTRLNQNETDIVTNTNSIDALTVVVNKNKTDIVNINANITTIGNDITTNTNSIQVNKDDLILVNSKVLSLESSRITLTDSVGLTAGVVNDTAKAVIKHTRSLVYTDIGLANAYKLARTWVKNDSVTLFNNMVVSFIATNTSTGISSLTVGNLASKPLRLYGRELREGDIIAGNLYSAVYDFSLSQWNLHINETDFERHNLLQTLGTSLTYTGKISYYNNAFIWREDIVAHNILSNIISGDLRITAPALNTVIRHVGANGDVIATTTTVTADGIPLPVGSSIIARYTSDFTNYELFIMNNVATVTKVRVGDIVIATAISNQSNGYVRCIGGRAVSFNCKSFPDTEWIPLTFLNGWMNYNITVYEKGEYRLVNDNIEIRGLIKGGLYTTGKAILKIPPDYKIKKVKITMPTTSGGDSRARLDISTAGYVIVNKLFNNAWVVLNITYSIN